jgi:hypothetical protein
VLHVLADMIDLPQPIRKNSFRILFQISDSEEKVVEILKGTNLDILSVMLDSYSVEEVSHRFDMVLRIPKDKINEFYFCLNNIVSYTLDILDTNADIVIRRENFIIDKIIEKYTEYDYCSGDIAFVKIKGIYK